MSTELSDLFATMRADADRVLLTPAEVLRRRADRRARRRALGIVCGALVAVLIVVGVSFAAVRARTTPPMPPVGSSPPSPAGTPSTSPSPSATSTATDRACRAADLSFVSSDVGGATGNTLDVYTLRNAASDPCQLSGAPVVTYANSRGTRVELPAEPGVSPPPDPVVLQPGGTATFWIERAGPAAGDITSGPTCVHNGVYPNLAIRFPDGSSVPLGGKSVQVWCGPISIGDWMST